MTRRIGNRALLGDPLPVCSRCGKGIQDAVYLADEAEGPHHVRCPMFLFTSLNDVRHFCRTLHVRAEFSFLLNSGDGLKYGLAMPYAQRKWGFSLTRTRPA